MSDYVVSSPTWPDATVTYGDEHVASRREAAPDVFAALDAVLLLHEETEQDDARRGHWEGHGSNEHWVRDQPKWCPVCNVAEPCSTRKVIIEALEGKR